MTRCSGKERSGVQHVRNEADNVEINNIKRKTVRQTGGQIINVLYRMSANNNNGMTDRLEGK